MRFPTMMRRSVEGRSALHGRPAESSVYATLAQAVLGCPEIHRAKRRVPRRAARVVDVAAKN